MQKNVAQLAEPVGAASTDRRERLLLPREFLQLATDEVDRASRYDRPLAAALVMLDGLALLRKTQGHSVARAAKDRTISQVVEMLRRPDRIAQLGPSELGILMPETTLKNAAAVSQRLCRDVDHASVEAEATDRITLSIGVVALSPRMRDARRFLMTGWLELRRARSRGGNTVAIASAETVRLSIPRSGKIH